MNNMKLMCENNPEKNVFLYEYIFCELNKLV